MPERLFTNKVRRVTFCPFQSRYRIVSLSAPRLAAHEPLQSDPAPANHSMRLSRFQKYAEQVGSNRQPEPGPPSQESTGETVH